MAYECFSSNRGEESASEIRIALLRRRGSRKVHSIGAEILMRWIWLIAVSHSRLVEINVTLR